VTLVSGPRALIKALIFDMGGVLEPPFDDVLVPALATVLGISAARLLEHRAPAVAALSEGRLTLHDFYARVIAKDGRAVDPTRAVARHLAVYEAATAQLDARVLALIQGLRRRHVVACLTNTEVEIGRFNRERGLFRPFDRTFLSTEMGVRKPERVIFDRALADLGCAPGEAVFTDDKLENALGAQAAGMHAIHYRDFDTFLSELARLVELDP
jgi:HAD superfamily hydrolase (TIGR01509 family)